jgi:hypothetical protein
MLDKYGEYSFKNSVSIMVLKTSAKAKIRITFTKRASGGYLFNSVFMCK